MAWTQALTPVRHPRRRSAPPALRVPSRTDAAPGGSPGPRHPRPGWEVGRQRASAPPHSSLSPAQGSTPRPPSLCPSPSGVCTLLTSRSMTARSARCQARSSGSSSDCSRNSWPGTVRIWGSGRERLESARRAWNTARTSALGSPRPLGPPSPWGRAREGAHV